MTTVKVSPKFQIVIPKEIRQSLGIKAGQSVQIIQYQDRIVVIPRIGIREARGIYKGIDTDVPRNSDRE